MLVVAGGNVLLTLCKKEGEIVREGEMSMEIVREGEMSMENVRGDMPVTNCPDFATYL